MPIKHAILTPFDCILCHVTIPLIFYCGIDEPEPHHHHNNTSHIRRNTCDRKSRSCAEDAPDKAADNSANQLSTGPPLTIPFIPLLCDETFTLIMKREKSTDAVVEGPGKGKKAPPTVVVDPDDRSNGPMTIRVAETMSSKTSCKTRPKVNQPASKSSYDTTPSETPSVSLVTVDGLDTVTSNKTKKKHRSVSENISRSDGTVLSRTPSRAPLDSDANMMSSQRQISTGEPEKTQIHGNPAPTIKVEDELPVVMHYATKADETIQDGVSEDRPRRAPITCWEADARQDGLSTKQKSQGGDDVDPETRHDDEEDDEDSNNNDVCNWLPAVGRKPTTRKSIERDTESSSVPENDPNTGNHADNIHFERTAVPENILWDPAHKCDEGLKENVKSPDENVCNKDYIQIDPNLELNEVPPVVESDDEFAFEIRVPFSDATPSPIEMEPVALVPDKPEKSTCTANEADEEDFFNWFDTFTSPTNWENDTGIKPVLSYVPPVTYKASRVHEQSISNFLRPVSPREDGAPVEVSTSVEYDQIPGPENGLRQSVEAQEFRPNESASDISERPDEVDRAVDLSEGSREGGPQHDDECPALRSAEPHLSEHELVKNKSSEVYSSSTIKADYTMPDDPEADVKPVNKAITPNWLLSFSSSKPEETTEGPDSKMASDEISLLERSSSWKPKTDRRRGLNAERHNDAALLDSMNQLPLATRSSTASKTSARIHDGAEEDDTLLSWLMSKSSSTSSKQPISTDMGGRTRDVRQRGTSHGITDKCNTDKKDDISTDWLDNCFGDSPSTRSKKIGNRHSSLSNASLKERSDPSAAATDMDGIHVDSPVNKAAIGRRLATPETAAVKTSDTKRNQTGRRGDETNWLNETETKQDNAKRQEALGTDPIARKEQRPEHFFFKEETSPGNDVHFPMQAVAGASQERQQSKTSPTSKSCDLDWLNGDQPPANKRKSFGRRAALDSSSSSSPFSNSRQFEGGIHFKTSDTPTHKTLDFGVKPPTDEDYVGSKKNPGNAERNGKSTMTITGCDDWPEDTLSGIISKRTRRSRPA